MIDEPKLPADYAFNRDWSVPEICKINRYVNLKGNWDHSKVEISKLRSHLDGKIPPEVRTVAVAGSLGRMEAAPTEGVSDCDAIVVLNDDVEEEKRKDVYDKVWEVLEQLRVEPPKATGNFAEPTTLADLCDKQKVGAPDEDTTVFSKRVLLLLETQPLCNDGEYQAIVDSVIESYAEGYVKEDPWKEWGFLINDLIRYFRSLCVNYQWDFRNEEHKWLLRNVKLRHSRLIMYGGLLMLLGECSRERKDKVDWLKKRLKLTPLERIAYVYAHREDTGFFRIAGLYNTFLGMLNEQAIRDDLIGVAKEAKEANTDSYKNRYQSNHYATLKASSDGLVAELVRFVLNQQNAWTERFFEYLLF